ncbi:MAG: CopD family protein [Ilumatobacteraceae bacterium]
MPDLRRISGVLVVLAAVVLGSGTALAHTDFDSSSPADGAVLDAPVDTVTILFTNPATPVGDEFTALDATGQVRTPTSVSVVGDRVFELHFDPALAGGEIGIRWKVQAGDAHPIEGSFSFTVTAPLTTEAEPIDAGQTVPPGDLDEFLAVDTGSPGDALSRTGRLLGLLGVVLGIGTFAVLALVLRGTRTELHSTVGAVRILGVVVAVGACIEYIGVARVAGISLADNLSTSAGAAAVLRVIGGVGLAAGLTAHSTVALGPRGRTAPPLATVTPAADQPTTGGMDRSDHPMRWRADSSSWMAYVGVGLLIVSFWFDGHTVSKGIRPLHAVVNSVHLIAGSVWAGGVVAIAAIMWVRFRRGQPTQAHDLLLRFSPFATLALVAVALAGLVMAVFVLDSFGELTSSEWGQILLLKTAAVALAAAGGAYNHFRLIPALDATPGDENLLAQARSTVTAEAIMLVFVVVVTAWLVTAAS